MSVILMYHRVASPSHDPYGLSVDPDRFAAHVEHLVDMGATVPLQDVVGPGSRRRVAITFDDGYADNATVAAPLLAAAGLPATWFITAGRLGRRRFWWDRLSAAVLGVDRDRGSVDVEIAGRALWLDVSTERARARALLFLHARLMPLPPEELEVALDHVLVRLGAVPAEEDGLTMTTDQLRALADLPEQQVGAHTRTHVQLSAQTPALQRDEVLGSIADLSSLLHRPIRTFAYPFGGPGTVGSLARRLVAEAGCQLACSTALGSVHRRTDRHLLPRLNVQDWERDEFAARLHAALSDR